MYDRGIAGTPVLKAIGFPAVYTLHCTVNCCKGRAA
jgi:hypothetical protein